MVILIVWVSSFLLLSLLIMLFSQKLLSKEEWTSDLWIVEMSKKWLLLLWLVYFMVRLIRLSDEGLFDGLEQRALAMVNYFKMFIGVNAFWEPLDILLGLTVTWMTYSLIYKGIKAYGKYELLSPQEFPEYDFPFQRDLVDFLNNEPKFGQNTYWLDGGWGTGKTHFLRTFFQKQSIKKLEIYYVSCFGIRTREQAEQVLIREIEDRSSFGSLDHIPVVGNLIKWGVTTLGLNLMKKDSVVIFDDLERVVYSEKENDDPKDYNDLLGFIDYLGNHKNQKVIVVYDSSDILNTQANIINNKFSPVSDKIPSVEQILEKIIEEENVQNDFIGQFLRIVYKIKFYNLHYVNFRELIQGIQTFREIKDSELELKQFLVDYLNQVVNNQYIQWVFYRLSNYSSSQLKGVSPYEFYEYELEDDAESVDENLRDYLRDYELANKIWQSYCEVLELLDKSDVLSDLVFMPETDNSKANILHTFDYEESQMFDHLPDKVITIDIASYYQKIT